MTIKIYFNEKDIEDYLCDGNNLNYHLGLKFINRQVKIDKYFIDILAYSKPEKCFYIIELKKDTLNSKAFTQAMKYHKLMTYKYKCKHKFKILLIGDNIDEDLYPLISIYDFTFSSPKTWFYILYSYEHKLGFASYNPEQQEVEQYIKENYNV